jgi:homoserine O-acetyltransferase
MSNIKYMPHAADRITKGKIILDQPLKLESGEILPEVEVAFTIYHSENNTGRKIAIFHGLSSDSNLHEWWNDFPLEKISANYEVISLNILGSCFGTTGPESINSKTGFQYRWSFPVLTIRDMAEASILTFKALGYQKMDAVLGCSLGGMIAAEIFLKNPSFCGKTISVCAAEFSKIM